MEIWFSEQHTPDVKLTIRIDRHLHSEESAYQRIDIFDSPEFGRFLTLDGFMMLTEKDEFIYHEMITHVAMASSPAVRKVLVIGAGDGGTVRELVRYPNIWHIDVAEIDERVVSVCKEYLQQTACGFYDNRVHMHFTDGLKYVRGKENFYDLIIVDSTDPFGPGEGLFTAEFYGNCENALTAEGILINQHESPYYDNDAKACSRAHKRIKSVFKNAYVYQAHIPTYPSGHWLFGFASKGDKSPFDFDKKAWEDLNIKTRYYNTDIHTGAFALPTYVKELLDS
jgi:spermidine synthase